MYPYNNPMQGNQQQMMPQQAPNPFSALQPQQMPPMGMQGRAPQQPGSMPYPAEQDSAMQRLLAEMRAGQGGAQSQPNNLRSMLGL